MGLTFAAKRPRRFWRPRTLIVLVVVLAIGAGALFVVLDNDSSNRPALPTGQVDAFLRAWGAGDWPVMLAQFDTKPARLAAMANSLVDAAPGNPNSGAAITYGSLSASPRRHERLIGAPGRGARHVLRHTDGSACAATKARVSRNARANRELAVLEVPIRDAPERAHENPQ